MKYTLKTALPENCVDKQGNLNPVAVLNAFQDAATAHGVELGVSYDEMIKRNLLWVVTRIHYKVCAKAEAGQKIVVTTWPLTPNRLGYERDYLITDDSGNILIKGVSSWAVIDADERHLVIEPNLYNTDELSADKAIDEKIRRIRNFEAQNTVSDIIPDESMIDCNNHVNNTYYALFAQKALGEFKGKIKSFQIDYHHEVLCGERLKMSTAVNENGLQLVKGEAEDRTLKFCVAVEYI